MGAVGRAGRGGTGGGAGLGAETGGSGAGGAGEVAGRGETSGGAEADGSSADGAGVSSEHAWSSLSVAEAEGSSVDASGGDGADGSSDCGWSSKEGSSALNAAMSCCRACDCNDSWLPSPAPIVLLRRNDARTAGRSRADASLDARAAEIGGGAPELARSRSDNRSEST